MGRRQQSLKPLKMAIADWAASVISQSATLW